MALSTKGLYDWASAFRNMFHKDVPVLTRSSQTPPSDVVMNDIQETLSELSSDEELSLDSEPELPPYEESQSDSDHDQDIQYFDPGLFDSQADYEPHLTIMERMEIDKARYPGAKNWATQEERLFEILYLRQDLPMLPSHWNVDFRGFPLPENIFDTSEEYPPIIYSHSKNGTKEYAATSAITKVIDLTLDVKTIQESAKPDCTFLEKRIVRRRAAEVVKDRLEHLMTWAARDGGYGNLRIVPNIVAEVVDANETQDEIVEWMSGRMRALCRLQREFYRVDRRVDFWTSTEPRIMGSRKKIRGSLTKRIKAGIKRGRSLSPRAGGDTPDLSRSEVSAKFGDSISTPQEYGGSKRKLFQDSGEDELDERQKRRKTLNLDADGHVSDKLLTHRHKRSRPSISNHVIKIEDDLNPPQTPAQPEKFRRRRPVLYGLFIMGTSVFVLTCDSSKGEDCYISFHIEIDFSDAHQSVWNALTVAIVICAARDEMMSRVGDFEPKEVEYESDPDA